MCEVVLVNPSRIWDLAFCLQRWQTQILPYTINDSPPLCNTTISHSYLNVFTQHKNKKSMDLPTFQTPGPSSLLPFPMQNTHRAIFARIFLIWWTQQILTASAHVAHCSMAWNHLFSKQINTSYNYTEQGSKGDYKISIKLKLFD